MIHILPTDCTPEIHLDIAGNIKIKGRGVTVYRSEILEQVLNWIHEYLENPAEITYVDIAFEYLNSYGTTMFTTILKELSQVNLQSKKLIIRWYYEEDDEDMIEKGMSISSVINVPIEFIITNRVGDI